MVSQAPLTLSISIVNTDHRDMLRDLLQSIYDTAADMSLEVIVVDNASTDGSREMVGKEFPQARLVRLSPRNGYGYCHNRGYEATTGGEYFLPLNEDMKVMPGTLQAMVERMESDDTIGVLGCKLTYASGETQVSCQRFPTVWTQFIELLFPYFAFPRLKLNRWYGGLDHDSEQDVDVILGACLLMRRSLIERIGLFDEQFYLFSDEIDLCKRVKNEGLRVCYTPAGHMMHYSGVSTRELAAMSVRSSLYYHRSRCRYTRKHHGILAAAAMWALFVARDLSRMVGWAPVALLSSRKRKLAGEQVRLHGMSLLWCLGLYRPQL